MCNFHVYNWENTNIKDLNVRRILINFLCIYLGEGKGVHFACLYTQTKVKQHHIVFGDTVLKVTERKMWVMEINYFEFYCKFYYFYKHFELQMILWTKYLDNSRPCTKQVKMIQKNNIKKCVADVWKIIFSLIFNSMESYHSEHLL